MRSLAGLGQPAHKARLITERNTPAVLSLQWSVPGRHVAIEHDACVCETWLSLGFPLRVPACTFEHRFKYQHLLTPCKNNTKKPAQIYTFILSLSFMHRSEGPHKPGLARICVRIISQVYLIKATTGMAAQPANTGLWLPNQTQTIYMYSRDDIILQKHVKLQTYSLSIAQVLASDLWANTNAKQTISFIISICIRIVIFI